MAARKKAPPKFAHDVYDFLEGNEVAKSALANWLGSGGIDTLDRLEGMARGDLFPYTAPQHVQASFGAFLGGVAWAVRTLKNAVEKSNNNEERRRMQRQAEGNVDQTADALMDRMYPGWRKMVEEQGEQQ